MRPLVCTHIFTSSPHQKAQLKKKAPHWMGENLRYICARTFLSAVFRRKKKQSGKSRKLFFLAFGIACATSSYGKCLVYGRLRLEWQLKKLWVIVCMLFPTHTICLMISLNDEEKRQKKSRSTTEKLFVQRQSRKLFHVWLNRSFHCV